MQQTWGCLFVQNYQGLAKTLTWKFWFLTYDHCIIKLTLLLKGFNIFHQSFFCLYLLIFYIYVQHPPVATITFIFTYGKLILSIPAALIVLACLWRTLKTHQFWSSERFPTVHRRKKMREFATILDTFSHQYVQVMLQRHCFCCIPSGVSRPCSREQIADSHLLVILQSSCESSFYFIPEHKGKKIPKGKGEFYNILCGKLGFCYFFYSKVFCSIFDRYKKKKVNSTSLG